MTRKHYLLDDLLDGIDGILFDMDGVLLDTEALYTEATKRVLGPLADRFDWRVKERCMGRAPLESARIVVEAVGSTMSPEEFAERKRPVLLELFKESSAKEGAAELVEHLATRGVPMVVASSSDRGFFQTKTGHHEWFRHFHGSVCGSDENVGRHKPAPDIFIEAAKLLGVPTRRCLVFEDSEAGVQAARAAEAARIVAIPDPNLDPALVADADVVIDSYAQIQR